MPVSILGDGTWNHPVRLPLGNGWEGRCQAPGFEDDVPSPDELHQFCNLGYAKCGRIPASRFSDAVRFGVAQDRGTEIVLKYALEKGHVPVTHGSLICDLLTGNWSPSHPDPRIQKMAQCFLQSYLQRRPSQTLAASTSS